MIYIYISFYVFFKTVILHSGKKAVQLELVNIPDCKWAVLVHNSVVPPPPHKTGSLSTCLHSHQSSRVLSMGSPSQAPQGSSRCSGPCHGTDTDASFGFWDIDPCHSR